MMKYIVSTSRAKVNTEKKNSSEKEREKERKNLS